MEQIIYVLSVVMLFILTMLLKKNEKELNLIKYLGINIVCCLCYNTFVCFVLNIIFIPITLVSLAIINYLISIVLLVIIIKNKTIQKYKINLKDIVAVIIIGIVTLSTALANFGTKLDIKYIMTDAAVHYKAAREFYQNDRLLNKTENTETSKQFMIGAYTNTGILFKVLEPVIGEVNLYKVFICFDISLYFLTGLMLYCCVEKLIKSKLAYVLSLLLICIFMIGYPLNSLIYGYVYLQLAIVIIETIVASIQITDEELSKKISTVILFLLNFGVIFSYCILAPVIYVAETLYFLLQQYKISKKYFSRFNIIRILITLVIPGILGVIYFAIPHLFGGQETFFLAIEGGYIYRNCWSNFILILPIAILSFKNRNKDMEFFEILFVTLILIMAIFLIAIKTLNFSTYYYFKYNFLLWFLLWYGTIYASNTLTQEKGFKFAIITYAVVYTTALILTSIFKYVPITKETWDDDENISNIFDIFGINKTIITYVEEDLSQEEMELVKYVYNNIDLQDNKILILGTSRQEYWFDAIFTYKNRQDLQTIIPLEDIQSWNNNEKFKYSIILYKTDYYKKYKDIFIEKNLLFKNDSGAIYINE